MKRSLTRTVTAALLIAGFMAGLFTNPYRANAAQDRDSAMFTGGGYAASGQMNRVGYSAMIYDASSGLPTSDANYILCTSDGHVLIGGYSGIIKYDGSAFERLDTSGGLTSGRVMFEDSLGRIWVGTNDNGVVVMEGRNSTHLTYKEGLPSSSIRFFAEDFTGKIYIGSTSGVCYVGKDLKVYPVDDPRINNSRVLKLQTDNEGRILGQTREGAMFALENGKVTEYYTGDDLGIEKITTFLVDPLDKNKVYIGTETSKVYYGYFGASVDKLKEINTAPLTNVHWLNFDCKRIWVSSTSEIGYIDVFGKFWKVKDLPMDSGIEMVTADYQGNLWAASSTQGVMKIVTNNFSNLSAGVGLPEEAVNATCLHGGKLYIGADDGLQVVERNSVIANALTEYLGDARIRCMLEDSDGNLWISTYTRDLGLVCLDKDGRISNLTQRDGMPSNEMRGLAETKDGRILVCTNEGLAIVKDNKVISTVTGKDGLKDKVILTVAEGSDGEIYMGTDGGGIYVLEKTGIRAIGRDQGLTSDVIMRLKPDDENGVMWIVTSNSIEYMRNGVITNVSTFPYTNNYDLYFDSNKNIWVMSSYGIYCVDGESMITDKVTEYRLYTTANGLTSVPTSNSYAALDDEGTLYIAGRAGVNTVNIDHFYERTLRVRTGISSITLNGEPVVESGDGTYNIPPQPGRIQIMPAILDYTMTNPEIRVFLDGADDDGITAPLSSLTPLEYTGLGYGTYTLHVQILSTVSREVIQDDTFKIVKKPRVMELLVVRILLLFLLALAAGLIVWRVMKGTVIRQQYDQIRSARDEAERANSAKSRFLANMSHEIRTPINTIMGMDEMLLREDATGVPQGYFMSVINYALDIRNASESLLNLINDLLDMSKIESGKMHLVEGEYSIVDLLRSIVSMIRVRSAEKDLTFDVSVDEILPVRLYGDSGKIKQIILNLLTNAVKYTNLGGCLLDVSVESRTDDEIKLRFSVKDTGIGIKEEDMDRLFTAYERLDEEKNTGIQGTGLGLDISRRFADLMGGSLTCESVYGEGSEFIFVVSQKVVDKTPVGLFTEHDDSANKGPYVPLFVAPDADVMVVDDNTMNLNVIKGLLKATRVFVTTAESGEECLEKLRYGTFDVILLDHMMPGMDGVETLARIRETHPDLPVYALTANATAGEAFYKEKGFTGYLQKPIDSAALERAIMKHLPEEIMMKSTAADAVEDLKELPEDMQWVKEVDDITVDEGIKNAGGISGFIHAIGMFHDTVDDNAKILDDSYAGDDIRLYTVKVHSIKTSARIIGATALSELAAKLEEAGNKLDKDFIDANNEKFLELFRGLKDKLARIHKSEESDSDREMIPEDELKDAYSALKEVIPQMDYDSVEMIINQVGEYKLPEEDEKMMSKIGKLLKAFKWDELEELIKDV
ncbi:MAG: response regulator [Lachnospiraceae bacterium]|nr:response regulator [Lachnospiraceae bacterium]